VESLIQALEQQGVRFRIAGEQVKLVAPAGRVPEANVIEQPRQAKHALLAALRSRLSAKRFEGGNSRRTASGRPLRDSDATAMGLSLPARLSRRDDPVACGLFSGALHRADFAPAGQNPTALGKPRTARRVWRCLWRIAGVPQIGCDPVPKARPVKGPLQFAVPQKPAPGARPVRAPQVSPAMREFVSRCLVPILLEQYFARKSHARKTKK
jgi:hypothetical protein